MKGYPSLFIVFHPRIVRSPTSSFDVLKKETWVRVTVFGIFVDLSGFVCSDCSSNWCVRAFYICHRQCDFVTPILFFLFCTACIRPIHLWFVFYFYFLFTVVTGFRGTRKPMTLTDPNNLEPLALRFSHPTRSPPGSLASRTIPPQCFCPDLGWSLPGRPLASTLTPDRATELSPSFPLSPLVACTKTTCEEYFIIHSLLSNRGNTPKTNKRWLNPTDVC